MLDLLLYLTERGLQIHHLLPAGGRHHGLLGHVGLVLEHGASEGFEAYRWLF